MASVHCLARREADVPADSTWLSALETAHLESLHVPKRCADWRLGRFTAKQALVSYLAAAGQDATLPAFELRPAPDGVPEPFHGGAPVSVALSLSHAGGWALCALAPAGTALGCDVERVEPRSAGFLGDFFTPAEQGLVATAAAAERERLATLIWSAKESALKALRSGLRRDTREVEVAVPRSRPRAGWWPLTVTPVGSEALSGWWRPQGDRVLTVVAAPAPEPPRWLVG